MPPAAAVTTMTSSARISATSRMPIVVRPVPIIATASPYPRPSGISWIAAASRTASSAYPPGTMPRWVTTRLPIRPGSTSGPTASTTPATSRPGIVGKSGTGIGPPPYFPARNTVSTRCTPAARTATRTWPGPGSGSSASS